MSTEFSPLDPGTRPATSIVSCLCWIPTAIFAVSLTVLGLIVMAPWAFAAWLCGSRT